MEYYVIMLCKVLIEKQVGREKEGGISKPQRGDSFNLPLHEF